MKKIIFLTLVLFVITTLSGCTFYNEKQQNEMTFKTARDMYQKNPTFAFYKKFQKNDFIFTYIDGDFIVLKEFAKTWQNYHTTHFGELYEGNEYEIQNIKNDVLMYILTLSQGSALGSANYNVYSLKDNAVYTIEAFGPHGSYNDLTIPDELKNNRTDILTYLETKISESKYTYVPKEEDLDIDIPQNAIKNWNLSNEDIYRKLDLQPNKWLPLNIKKFNTDDVKDFFAENINKDYIDSSKWEFENDQYKITSYFKRAIYAFDKKENKSFVLWVPTDMYEWAEKIEFFDIQTIVLYNRLTDKQSYKIDLQKMMVMKLK